MSNILTDNIPALVTTGFIALAYFKTPLSTNATITPSIQNAYRQGFAHAAIGAVLFTTYLEIRR